MNVPECVSKCVQNANDMACEKMGHGPIQTGDVGCVTDGNGEPNGPHRIVLETVPAPRDAACEVRSVFCGRPERARLRDRESALKRSAPGARYQRQRLKWGQIGLFKFGKHVAPCDHVHGGRRDAWSKSRGCHGKLRRVRVQVTSSTGTTWHEGYVTRAGWLTWWLARRRAVDAIDGAMIRFRLFIAHTEGTSES